MANKVIYNPEGYIEVTIHGSQTSTSFAEMGPDIDSIIEMLQKSNKPIFTLVDITDVGNLLGADLNDLKWSSLEMLQANNYDRLAIFGTNKIVRSLTEAVINITGKRSKIKLFSDREVAVKWLLFRERDKQQAKLAS